ncbi:hypothetical protein [Klebsiella pneumoniae]|uniref:hypothetical protein n=1 Tax=Klebsiella pneumoniae TaxID=573 RepID=UPI0039196E55
MTDTTELALRLKLEVHRAVSNFNPQMNIKTRDLKELVESLEKALQRIAELDKDCRVYENNVKNLLERAGSAESSCAEAARILQSGERMALTRAITILQGPGISHCDGGIKPDEVNL